MRHYDVQYSPRYEVVEDTPTKLVIRDVGPWTEHPTITNRPEEVVTQLAARLGSRRLLYYDSEGELAQLMVRDGRFDGFTHFATP
jgi:hypothetical protein